MRKKKTLVLALAEDSYDRSRNSSSTTKSLPWPFRGKTKKDHENKGVPYFSLFRYASTSDKVLVILGVISNVVGALGLPLIIMFYGEFVTLLVDRKMGENTISPVYIISWFGGGRKHKNGDEADLAAAIKEDAVAFGIGCTVSAVIQLVFSFLSVLFLNFASLKQSSKIRRLFLKAVLRQDMSWFDVNNANNFASKVTEDLDKIQEGMGEKIGLFLFLVLTFLSSVIMAFFKGWKLTLVILVCSPFIIISNAIIGKVQTNLTADELKAYGKAGSVAQEVFSSIKTVMSFGGEEKEIERYQKELESSRKSGIRRGRLSGYGGGFMWFIFYACHSLAFWYGVKLILESREAKDFEYTPSVIIMVFFGVIAGAMNMGYAAPHLEAFAAAKGAASSIFSVIERVPAIDSLSPSGKILSDVKGEIQFRNVAFQYPARPETRVLQGFNINIKEGQVVALVGSSGSGKSTVVQLLQRFYDPSEGSVLLDGEDLKNLNVSWLRRQIGVVGQEPSLFGTTIYENIKYGLENATREDVENAAKLANAHDFIMKLPKNYETVLGEKGTQISGGQKQRIAIARALIRNPKILLLDEATSALDAANERVVQLALNRATKGRTTLVVSHKISNITTADKIIVLSEGRIVEEGTHDELIALKNHYFRLLHMESTAQPDIPPSITTNLKDVDLQSQRPTPVVTGRYSVGSLNGSIALTSQEPEDIVDDEDIRPAPVSRIFKLSKPEWLYLLLGSISTLLVGASLPVVAVLFGELYGVLSDPDPEYMMSATSYYCGLFLAIGVVVGIGTFFQSYAFNKAGVELTTRMRIAAFSAILKQEPGWFDDEKNRTGVLCARLSGDASSMQGAAGSRISVILQSLSTLLIGAILSLFYSWKMTLVTLITVPVVFFGIFLESRVIQGQSLLEKKSIEKATKVAIEAITNIRTVASLGKEQSLLDLYDKELLSGERTMHIKSVMRGFAFALGQTAPFVCYGISLWYGGVLVADEGLHYKNVIKVSEALLYGAWVLGQSLAFAPNFLAAKLSAARIFKILDRTPKISNGIMRQDPNWQTDGHVSFNQVKFAYPTRPEVEVLKGLDLDIQKGLSIALAGQSGCGKSTIIQLLQKLYDPLEGKIYLDDLNLSDMEISKLRKQFGLVSQEPVLFDRTIAENIAYGDNTRKVPHCDIIAAAKSANIHDFISCLPLGYETRLGAGGAQLSGGQKQRIAIARALVRNPKILLLDEATSALDPASESVVQAALDSAVEGRTTITIGHRPGAVLRADVIYFLDQGRITEKGTHEELLRAKGKYADMHFHDKS